MTVAVVIVAEILLGIVEALLPIIVGVDRDRGVAVLELDRRTRVEIVTEIRKLEDDIIPRIEVVDVILVLSLNLNHVVHLTSLLVSWNVSLAPYYNPTYFFSKARIKILLLSGNANLLDSTPLGSKMLMEFFSPTKISVIILDASPGAVLDLKDSPKQFHVYHQSIMTGRSPSIP